MANTKHDEEKWKIEERALTVLRQSDMFDGVNLIHAEKPDIQTEDKSWGIEVVTTANPEVMAGMNMIYKKHTVPNDTTNTRFRCRTCIGEEEKCTQLKSGEKISFPKDEPYSFEMATLPSRFAPGEVVFALYNTILQKVKKLQKGHYNGFDKTGLFVFTEIPVNTLINVIDDFGLRDRPIMFDYIFFFNSPYQNLLHEYIPGKLLTAKVDELST